MKVITIKQPWATLIAEGLKEYEFRTWNTKFRGDILIHAGKGIDQDAMKRFESYNLQYPSVCIIAKAKLTDSVYVDDKFIDTIVSSNPLIYGNLSLNNKKRYGFKLENVEKIEPIYVNGNLSLWNFDYNN